jgi:YD repeat-containing protein
MKKYIILIILSLGCWVGIHAQTPQKMTYVYDALNRLTEVTYPNGSKITYNYDVLGNRNSVVTVSGCALPTATLTGTQTITVGQSANLSVTLTGIAPWSIVMNGTTYTANASPFSISVNPSTTTTYNLTSVSNSCGAGTVSGSAVVTVNACTNMYTLKTGNWNDTTVWSCGRVPTSTDIITIKSNHFITIPASYTANAKDVIFEAIGGKFIYAANSSKLCLSCPTIPTNGLIGYFSFNGNANDESGSGFNGTIVGSPVFVTGTINQAIRTTPNTGQYVQIPNNNTLQNISFVSISVWVKPASFDLGCFNDREMIVGKGQDIVTNGYGISIQRNTNAGCGNATSFSSYKMSFEYGGSTISTPFYNVDNQWRHVLVTYDRNIMKIYINGVLIQQQTVGIISAVNTLPMYFNYAKWNGGSNNTNGRFGGDIDNIRIYNLALSDSEVLQVYNVEKP